MATCARCGHPLSDAVLFCGACGAPVGRGTASETRKVVTVLFSDLVGSTRLGEMLDAEALRYLMSRYFDALRVIIERHGGTVEKFIGDAVMAVFGIPLLHEDDALRAVRAAHELLGQVSHLADELEPRFGIRISNRTGVNTGEVIASEPSNGQRLVTGDAVNLAARLEQSADAGEVLISETTHRMVRGAVKVEPVPALQLKGKREAVVAYRLLDVLADVPAVPSQLDTPLIGRGSELEALLGELDRCIAERACRLTTIIGAAGIGKSRLVRELIASRPDARSVTGHCLPYGEGITYWPLVEILKQIAGNDAQAIATIVGDDGPVVAQAISAAVGQSALGSTAEEIYWAVRKLLEALARQQPLIVVVDDLEWAEPTFLDLIEYLLGFSSDAPISLLVTARPTLLEHRPSWTTPRPSTATLVLQALSSDDSLSLVQTLSGGQLRDEVRDRILATAEGNPLFVEQLLALQTDDGAEDTVPLTIQALLDARIDHLEPGERAVIGRAAIEGRTFHRGALAALTPDHERGALSSQLLALVRKELIRPSRAEFEGDDAFRFGHILIRDAAYRGVPKQIRADLHERFAGWLELRAGDRVREYEEILAQHLELAYRYRTELGMESSRTRQLARRAAELLGSAGRRALSRVDLPAATKLLQRAVDALATGDALRRELLVELGEALTEAGDFDRATRAFQSSEAESSAAGDERMLWRARVARAWVEIGTGEIEPSTAATIADEAVSALDSLHDNKGLALAWKLAAQAANMAGSLSKLAEAMRRVRAHAYSIGDQRLETEAMFWLGLTAFFSLLPLSEATATCRALLDTARTPLQRAHGRFWLAACHALGGDFDEIGRGMAEARAMYADLGMRHVHGGSCIPVGQLSLLAGDAAGAVAELDAANEELALIGEQSYRASVLLLLAVGHHRLGHDESAASCLAESLALGPNDTFNQGAGLALRAAFAAAAGRPEEARRLAGAAIDAAGPLGDHEWAAMAFDIAADALHAAGDHDGAVAALHRALEVFERKEATPAIELTRAALAQLGAG
jgi:class 3 adenylate cyclase/tetratricopeptide (TPR) repeat protein